MAANQAPTSAVTIVPNGDLTIVLSDADNKTYRFKVDRATMASNSEHFKASLQGRFKEATTNVINLIDDNAVGLQAFLRAIHDRLAGFSGPFDSPIWWHIVMACDKYEIDVRDKSNVVTMRLRKFFGECYKKQGYRPATLNVNLCRQLMYPSFIFDEAHAFHLVTRYLAYNGVGHITEINPTGLYQLHLPNRIISKQAYIVSSQNAKFLA